jgi:adenine specific DNA methylase Mod
LKILMDAFFGAKNFRNEITWKRRAGMSSAVHESNRFGACTDIILFYAKTDPRGRSRTTKAPHGTKVNLPKELKAELRLAR